MEQAAGVSTLLEKITKFGPRIVCFVGLGIADIVKSELALVRSAWKCLAGVLNIKIQPKRAGNSAKSKAEVGLQPYKVVHSQTIGSTTDVSETLFFAVSSTSGRVVRYQVRTPCCFHNLPIWTEERCQKNDKIQQFKDLRHILSQIKDKTFDGSEVIPIVPQITPSGSSYDNLWNEEFPKVPHYPSTYHRFNRVVSYKRKYLPTRNSGSLTTRPRRNEYFSISPLSLDRCFLLNQSWITIHITRSWVA